MKTIFKKYFWLTNYNLIYRNSYFNFNKNIELQVLNSQKR